MPLSRLRLRLRPRLIDEEDDHFLIRHGPHIDAAMDSGLRRIPIREARVHRDCLDLSRIAVLDMQFLSGYDDCKAVTEILMPGQRLARLEYVPANDQISSLGDGFGFHEFTSPAYLLFDM